MNKRCGSCLPGAHTLDRGERREQGEKKQKLIGKGRKPYNGISLVALGHKTRAWRSV